MRKFTFTFLSILWISAGWGMTLESPLDNFKTESCCFSGISISSFSPSSATSGNTITISGTGFTGAIAVSFGGSAASSFNVVSDNTVTAVVGSGSSGNVSVVTPGGTFVLSGFTFCQFYPFFTDGDNDGFGTGSSISVCAANAGTPLTGYATNNSDCNDANPAIHASYFFFVDADTDGFGAGSAVSVCAVNGSTPPAGYSMNSSDCNDSNAAIHQLYAFFVDADADGFGTGPLTAICAVNGSSAPAGYATNNSDCNDANPAIHATFFFYADADADGFGAGVPTGVCAVNASTPPAGYSSNNSDCNDSNAAMHLSFPFYTDADGDGFGVGFATGVCAVNASTPPPGYASNNTDCSDSNAAVHAIHYFYLDADQDGFGVGGLVAACAANAITAPAGYSSNNTDCNDSNSAAWQMGTAFIDADNDGYTTGATALVCLGTSAPSGYALTNIGIDCNDSVAAIHPGTSEVLYNGVDDDCDGDLDEGFELLSQILPTQCGTTLISLSSLISAVNFNNSTAYRFEVTNTTTNLIQVIERPYRWFSLNMLPLFDYATTYSIRVMMQRNGIWLGYYGPSCLVSSPAVLDPGGAAQVAPSQCGITLPTINTLIATTSIQNVSGYRFRITNMTDPTAPNQVQTIDRTLHWFALTMLPTYIYGTSYLIEVSVKTNGVYSGFGSPCVVSSPEVPMLVPCGGGIPSPGTIVAVTNKSNVASYRFEITNLNNNIVTTIDRPVHWFKFNMVPGFVQAAPYGVRVSLMSSGTYSPFGDACELTSPGEAREGTAKGFDNSFDATTYPNPFAQTFNIDVTTSAAESLTVKVYDMTGRLLETRTPEVSELETLQIGDRYPAGVYNVIVSQGANVKTLRIVKR